VALVDARHGRACGARRVVAAQDLAGASGGLRGLHAAGAVDEGELVGGSTIARELIRRASDATFQDRAGGVNVDDIIMWFDEGGALQVADESRSDMALKGFEIVPDLLRIVHHTGLAQVDDAAISVAACELVLEALVARKKISRSDTGQYGRANPEPRRRPNQDLFGGGMS
jgi:magnesium chelatase subunit I